jgi:hypothetical protein
MANSKISALTSATTPLAGTETLPIVQSSTTKQVSVANLTVGRAVNAASMTISGDFQTTGNQFFYSSNGGGVAAGHLYSGSTGKIQAWIGSNPITETTGADFKNLVGNFIPNVAGQGINFTANTPASGMTSQLLNWYEEGTWTPADASGAGLTFTGVTGKYTRIGRQVTATAVLTYPTTADTSQAKISGLPFAVSNMGQFLGIKTTTTAINGLVSAGATTIFLYTQAGVTLTNANNTAATVYLTGTYFV